MPGWESALVEGIQKIKSDGGVTNVMQPAKMLSIDPPLVQMNGVVVEKQLDINPAMRTEEDLAEVTDAMDAFMEKFQELEQHRDIEDVSEFVDKLLELLAEPLQKLFEAVTAYHEKGLVHPGDTVMVRQDGNSLHVMTGIGGGGG